MGKGRSAVAEDLAAFSSHLALRLRAGFGLPEAVAISAKHTRNPALLKALGRIQQDVSNGSQLTQAMKGTRPCSRTCI
jgi:type II secretory pathway component PulF